MIGLSGDPRPAKERKGEPSRAGSVAACIFATSTPAPATAANRNCRR